MDKRTALKRPPKASDPSILGVASSEGISKVLRAEREQQADQSRIQKAIAQAEAEIAALERRSVPPGEVRRSLIRIRDRTVLNIRDVRRNMINRAVDAKNLQGRIDDALRQYSRFATQDHEDQKRRTRLLELLGQTPTFRLIRHLQDAFHAGDFASSESIRFEFMCRDDRHEYTKSFEKVLEQNAPHDLVEARKQTVNIYTAAETTEQAVADFLCECARILPKKPQDDLAGKRGERSRPVLGRLKVGSSSSQVQVESRRVLQT